MIDEQMTMRNDDQAVNADERIGGLTAHGSALVFMQHAHQTMSTFEVIEKPLLDVVRQALMFSATWRACYSGCVCQRCQMDEAVRALVDAIVSLRQ